MVITITYKTRRTQHTRTRQLIRDSVREAIKFFEWRYGHEIISVTAR